jgi:hypothetical protein
VPEMSRRESARIFELMLKGMATTEEYVAALRAEAREYIDGLGAARPERHSEAYDPGPRRRIGGHYFDVDDVPPRGDRDY